MEKDNIYLLSLCISVSSVVNKVMLGTLRFAQPTLLFKNMDAEL